jgi:hemerythrin-like domain-containing protein
MLDIIKAQIQRAQRHDIYATIHRGLRRAETDLLARIGATDGDNADAVADMIARFRKFLRLARFHLVDENEFVHTALEERLPGSSARLAEDHSAHERSFEELDGMLTAIESMRADSRDPLVKALYLRFSEFVAHDFEHMLEEETVVLPLMQGMFSDEELVAIEQQIITSIPPDVMLEFIAIMVPAVDRRTRADMVLGMRKTMSPETFRTILRDTISPVLDDDQWRHLGAALNRAA